MELLAGKPPSTIGPSPSGAPTAPIPSIPTQPITPTPSEGPPHPMMPEATQAPPGPGTVSFTPQEVSNLAGITAAGFITFIIRLLFILAFLLAFIFLIIGGIRWILAGGEEKAVAQARGMVIGAIIGLVIILASFALIKILEFFFNVSIISGGTVSLPQVPM